MAGPTCIVSIGDAKNFLGIDNNADDYRLQVFIDGLTPVIEQIAGPVIQRTVTEIHDGRTDTIMLRQPPVVSITSVDEFLGRADYTVTAQPLGQTVDNYGYSIDNPDIGLLVRRSSAGTAMPFLGGPRMVRVVYVAGRAMVPPNIKLAALTLVQLNYEPLTQGGRPAFQNAGMALDDMAGSPMIRGFLVPNYVKEMLADDATLPGIA